MDTLWMLTQEELRQIPALRERVMALKARIEQKGTAIALQAEEEHLSKLAAQLQDAERDLAGREKYVTLCIRENLPMEPGSAIPSRMLPVEFKPVVDKLTAPTPWTVSPFKREPIAVTPAEVIR